jgi:Site-specific recombinases, DNA invertase Pin homologs
MDKAKEGQYWTTALYIRLSREDGDKEESDSVGNQRDMLTAYLESNRQLKLFDIYIDDGYTGTNFNRPQFKRMIQDMKKGLITCIVVKDLSRFGRDYLGVGNYQENIFPQYDTRFIAVNDHIDTLLNQDGSDGILVPFKNIINEQYARDISRKVRSALDTKRRRGEFIGAFACYGYQKDPADKNHLIVDEQAAGTVKLIFSWFISGTPKLLIASKLNELNLPCPSEYKKQKGQKYKNANRLDGTVYWTHTAVHRILKNEMYLGNMVQHTQTVKNFKQKKNIQLDRSDWIVVQGTHEAVIDRQTWNVAQGLLQSDIKRSPYTGEIHLFAGIIKCGDCGRSMKKRTCGNKTDYLCGTYMTYGKKYCTSHAIRAEDLKSMVYAELRAQIEKRVDFDKIYTDIHQRANPIPGIKAAEEKIAELQRKLDSVSALKRGLYEDLKRGILSEDEYFLFKQDYDKQANKVQSLIAEWNLKLSRREISDSTERLDKLIGKYKDPADLTRELLVSLVKTVFINQDGTIAIDLTFQAG